MYLARFFHNYSLTWGLGRYEIRLWRRWPYKIDFVDWGSRIYS